MGMMKDGAEGAMDKGKDMGTGALDKAKGGKGDKDGDKDGDKEGDKDGDKDGDKPDGPEDQMETDKQSVLARMETGITNLFHSAEKYLGYSFLQMKSREQTQFCACHN